MVVPRRNVEADVDLVDAQRLRREHGLDRIGQVIVQSGLHLAHQLTEAEHDAEFIRFDAQEAGKSDKATAASPISAMPRPPRLPGSRLFNFSWLRRRNSSRSGGRGPPGCCGPEPHGPLRDPEPQGPPGLLLHGILILLEAG